LVGLASFLVRRSADDHLAARLAGLHEPVGLDRPLS
jgi:hypothetical protein